jgi:hypothetical protein
MLRLTAVGVNGAGPQPMWERQPDGQLLNHAADGSGDLVKGNGRVGHHLAADSPQAGGNDSRWRAAATGGAVCFVLPWDGGLRW